MAIFEECSINELTMTGGLKDDFGNWVLRRGSPVPPVGVTGFARGCLFIDSATGKLHQNEGTASSCLFISIADIRITPIRMGTRALVALADANATPTAAELIVSSIFTITPTAARLFTVPTAALMVAGIPGATVGTWFDFTIVNLAAFAVTVTTAAGVTLVGSMAVTNASATFRALLTSVTAGTETVSIYRM